MPQRFGSSAVVVATAVAVVALAACGGGTESPSATTEAAEATVTTPATDTETPATDGVVSGGSIAVDIQEENASGQTGTATITPNAPGVDVAVQVTNDEGVAQFAGISEGTCEELGAPFIELQSASGVPPGTKDGIWQDENVTPYGADALTLDDLRNGTYAVVVVDVSYRGGNAVEIPPDVRIYEPPDPNGPFGEGYPLAACGEIS